MKRTLATCCTFVALPIAAASAQLPPTPEKTGEAEKAQPRLFVETRSQKLGRMLEGEIVEVSWKLENRGAADLVIDRTSAACGCTVVKLRDEDKVIRPGAVLNLQVTFDSTGRHGEQNKDITVFSNDPLEPQLRLDFHAVVDQLFRADPASVVNLRVLRRGETAQKPLTLLPIEGRGDLVVTDVDIEGRLQFETRQEQFEENSLKGVKLFFTVLDTATLGPLSGAVNLTFRVGELERKRSFSVRGEIIADLTWLPKVVDATRQAALPGTALAPVVVSSTDQRTFQILDVSAGPMLSVTVGPGKKPKVGTEYSVQATISPQATAGPFGTTLRIATNTLDQPVIEVPVFGIVAAPVEIEPPSVLIRKDGTEAGIRRRFRVKTANASAMKIESVSCDLPAIAVSVDRESSAKYIHLVYLEARLTGTLDSGTHHSVIRITTDVPGAEKIEAPVRIEIP